MSSVQSAPPSSRPRSRVGAGAGASTGAAAAPRTRVRWDRLGRVVMLLVLCVLLYLYISPVRSLIGAVSESGRRQAEVASLTRGNLELRAQRAALATPATRERDARNLGLVRPGEKEFVVLGLPAN